MTDQPDARSPYGSNSEQSYPRPDTNRGGDARRPLAMTGSVLLILVPGLFGAVWLVTGRDGSRDEGTFSGVLLALSLSSMFLGALILGLVGYLRLVTGSRNSRPAFPSLPPRQTTMAFARRRTARVDLRSFWFPSVPLLLAWAVIGVLQPPMAPGLGQLVLVVTGLSFFAFLYFWSLGFLRVYSVGGRPSLTFLAIGALTMAAFLLPFLIADPTRYPGLFPARGIVLLQPSPKPILPRP